MWWCALGLEAVAETGFGDQVPRMCGLGFELATQLRQHRDSAVLTILTVP